MPLAVASEGSSTVLGGVYDAILFSIFRAKNFPSIRNIYDVSHACAVTGYKIVMLCFLNEWVGPGIDCEAPPTGHTH